MRSRPFWCRHRIRPGLVEGCPRPHDHSFPTYAVLRWEERVSESGRMTPVSRLETANISARSQKDTLTNPAAL